MSTEIDQKNKPETTKTRLTRTSAYPGRKMGREVYLKFPQSEMLTRVCRKSAPWPAVEPSDTRGFAGNSTGKYHLHIVRWLIGSGRMIDTASGCGKTEARLGEIIDEPKVRGTLCPQHQQGGQP